METTRKRKAFASGAADRVERTRAPVRRNGISDRARGRRDKERSPEGLMCRETVRCALRDVVVGRAAKTRRRRNARRLALARATENDHVHNVVTRAEFRSTRDRFSREPDGALRRECGGDESTWLGVSGYCCVYAGPDQGVRQRFPTLYERDPEI